MTDTSAFARLMEPTSGLPTPDKRTERARARFLAALEDAAAALEAGEPASAAELARLAAAVARLASAVATRLAE